MKIFYSLTVFLVIIIFQVSNVKAQWVKTNGPEGICVTSFYNVGSDLLCGTYAQGVFRSSDNGSSWTLSNTGVENKWIDCFVEDSLYLYAGCFGEGVFRSSDNGLTWQPANAGIQTQAVFSLYNGGGYLFAGTVGNGLFRSDDHGNTWTDANGGALTQSFIHAIVYCPPRLMVEADNYIFYSFDFGNSWYVDQGTTQFYVINSFLQQGDTVLAAAGSNLFRTYDGGNQWSSPVSVSENVVGFALSGDTIYAGTGYGALYSSDWGISWNNIPASGLRSGASAFTISGTNMVLGRNEIGVAVSSDFGSNWTQTPLTDFTRASTIDDALEFANGTLFSGTHGNGVYATTDAGNNWNKIGTINPFDTLSNASVFAILPITANIILAGTCGSGLYRTDNGGSSWTHITAGLPQQTGTGFTCVKTLEKCGSNILAALTEGVYYSTDNGLSWHNTNLTGSNILQAGGFAVRGNVACVGVIAFPTPSGVYRSTDYGVSWTLASPLLDIEFMATGGNNTMYAGQLFGASVSHDDGLTWYAMNVNAAFTILAWDEYCFIGNQEGVYFSDDYGNTFTLMIQGMDPYPNNAVQGLAVDNQFVYAGTFRDAVWRRPLSDFGFTSVAEHNNKAFLIYPNPASAYFNISFASAEGVTITITDIGGRIVYEQSDVSETLHINCHTFENGIYLIRNHTPGKPDLVRLVSIQK